MEKFAILISTLLLGSILFSACTPSGSEPAVGEGDGGEVKTFYVGPETAECVGVAPQTCLLVKESPDADYQFFYDNIEGFEYEPGYDYELLVRVDPVENPPADASSLRYTLVEEVSKTPVETTNAPLEGTLWQMTSYTNVDGKTIAALPDVASTATFENGNLSGSDGCNSYGAAYTLDGSNLTIMPGMTTLMACTPPVDAQAAGFNAALPQTASYSIDGTTLTLADAEGNDLATFEAIEPLSLTDTVWQVTGYNNGKEAVVSVMIGSEITAEFNPDGMLTGSGGCNTYNASYETDGDSITIGPAASTRMLCGEPEGIMEQETQYLTALSTAATYRIDGNRMEMRTADGALVASFQAR